MRTGSFFKAVKDSRINTETVEFKYLPITLEKYRISEQNIPYQYPISIFITENTIKCTCIALRENSIQSNSENIFSLPVFTSIGLNDEIIRLHDSYHQIDEEPYQIIGMDKIVENSYSNLSIFNVHIDYQKEQDKCEENKLLISIRKILLDFFFDLEHSTVFQESSYYYKVLIKLKESNLLRLILHKAEYYYLVNYIENYPSLQEIDVPKINILFGKTYNAQNDWLNLLREENAENIINKNNSWFNNIEDEHQKAYELLKTTKQIRNSLFTLINSTSQTHVSSFTHIQNIIGNIEKELHENYDNINLFMTKEKRKIDSESVDWFLRKYDIVTAAHLQFFHVSSFLEKLFAFLISFIILFYITHFLKISPIEIYDNFDFVFLSTILISIIFILIYIKNNIKTNLLLIFIPITALPLYRLIYVHNDHYTEIMFSVLFIASIFFISTSLAIIAAHIASFSLKRIIRFFSPRLFLSSLVIWFLFGKYPILWNLNHSITSDYFLLIIFIVISLYILVYIKLSLITSKELISTLERVTLVILVGIIYSFIIGLGTISYNAEKIFTQSNTIGDFFITKILVDDDDNKFDSSTCLSVASIDSLLTRNFNKDCNIVEKHHNSTFQSKKCLEASSNSTTINRILFESLDTICAPYSNHYMAYKFEVIDLPMIETIRVFPGILFVNTFLALFIGVSIQVAFGNRPTI